MTLSIGGLITFLIVLVAVAVLVWLAFYILQNFPPPEPLGRIIKVAIVVVAVLIVLVIMLNFAGIGTGIKVSSWGEAPLSETSGLMVEAQV